MGRDNIARVRRVFAGGIAFAAVRDGSVGVCRGGAADAQLVGVVAGVLAERHGRVGKRLDVAGAVGKLGDLGGERLRDLGSVGSQKQDTMKHFDLLRE